MALRPSARAMLRGLAKIGEPSTLAGSNCGPVVLERDVRLDPLIGDTANDNAFARYTIASLAGTPAGVDYLLGLAEGTTAGTYNPRVGQALVHPDGAFVLDRLYEDNGAVRRFILTAA